VAKGPGDVLQLIRHGRASTRGDVLEITGLSRMTVAQRVDALLRSGLITEGPNGEATGGRRPRLLRFNTEHRHVLAASVDTTHTKVAITNLAGRIIDAEEIDVEVTKGPEHTLQAVVVAARDLLCRVGESESQLCGIGISVPGPIDPESGLPNQPPILPGWDSYPIADHLQEDLRLPVVAANDADAAALGEYTATFPNARALCLVKVATGIGTGIVIDGSAYCGADGGAGDIGHVRLRDQTEAICQCGARGCLAAVASGRAVATQLTELGYPAGSGRDVGVLLAHGNPEAARLTQEAGRLIGEVLATVVCVLNPEVVTVGGALASPPLLAGMQESLYRLSPPRSTGHLSLRLARLGEDAAVVGLTRMVVDQEFAAAAVDARLAQYEGEPVLARTDRR
jgi:predicted NBD/HSP70 family sugar kinase